MPDVVSALEGALAGMVDSVTGVAAGWLVLGVVLHLANQLVRGRGWYAVIRMACDDAGPPRKRDAIMAWVAGAGAGGVVSARGGDAVRVLVLAPRMPGKGCRAVLTGTLVAETAGETGLGVIVLVTALAAGLGPQFGPSAATGLYALAGILVVTAAVYFGRRIPRVRRFLSRVGCGCAALRAPGAYTVRVMPWQIGSRVLRMLALGCFLAAFGLPATPAAILLVVLAQGGGRLVPFSPAAVGAGAAILAATFGPVTGTQASASELTAFFLGTSTVLTVIGTAIALAICVAQASANAGPRLALGRLMRIRAAAAPRP
jgi:uncharacterized membrane protein YbhN (UPF0104 family)